MEAELNGMTSRWYRSTVHGGSVVPLPEETLAEFGHNISDLDDHSNKRVMFRCECCQEMLVREWRLRGEAHRCLAVYNYAADDLHQPIRLECKLMDPRATLPKRSRTTDAGYDLTAIHDAVVPKTGTANIETGIALSAPPGYYYSIDGRSSMWSKGIVPFRGIIDATFTGPLSVVLMNTSQVDYHVCQGDRIAQIILNRINHCDISVVEQFSPNYNRRGNAGFGSSGK